MTMTPNIFRVHSPWVKSHTVKRKALVAMRWYPLTLTKRILLIMVVITSATHQLIEDRGLSSRIKPNHQYPHIGLTIQSLPYLAESRTLGSERQRSEKMSVERSQILEPTRVRCNLELQRHKGTGLSVCVRHLNSLSCTAQLS